MNHFRRRSVASFLAALLAGSMAPGAASGQTPKQACNDPIPKSCGRARFLGEDRGCGCFVCNPDSRASRKVVCTRAEADMKALFKLVPPTTAHRASAAGLAPGR